MSCNHKWMLVAEEGTKSMLGVSLLLYGCPKCGVVKRYVEGEKTTLTELECKPSNSPRVAIIRKRKTA